MLLFSFIDEHTGVYGGEVFTQTKVTKMFKLMKGISFVGGFLPPPMPAYPVPQPEPAAEQPHWK